MAGNSNAEKTIKVTWRSSTIGYTQDQRHTIQSLGLRRLNQTVEKPDTAAVRGMVYKVRHLVQVEGVPEVTGTWVRAES